MIKKPTLIVLLCALLLAGGVYFFDYRRSLKEKEKPVEDISKPAFSIPAGSEINSLTIRHPALSGMPPIQFEKRNGGWQILQPLQTYKALSRDCPARGSRPPSRALPTA
jgi:hypothetical protein